ncbi:electron transporter RnfD [Pedobacter aquae]|uniref:Electron transporter RnfD n=1 Tax=Pedobacter aquae TaxID=2605747 RepID=A0A5C0VFN2_9SPHI|nr:GDSL-type esterase/lipase family protein [Pedobacter aquae]QEK51548.1 electron transporter RnfD [Pedobacter aquae]
MKKHFLFFIFWLVSYTSFAQQKLNPQHKAITYQGRIKKDKAMADLYWSATSVKLNFKGSGISATFQDETGNNYYNIIIDGDSSYIFRPEKVKKTYILAQNLKPGKHQIEIFKRTEWTRGKTIFYGFELPQNAKFLPADKPKSRKIEFYGNSITAGYAVEDFSGKDSPDSTFTNAYLSYAHLTAKHFDAQYHSICRSGIGIMISWFPLIMPQMYDRLNPNNASSKWDFKQYTPEAVVVNLFQNDSWLVKKTNTEGFKTTFGTQAPTEDFIIKSYQNFLTSIRNKYPKAKLVCILGNMDITREGSPWPAYVKKAVAGLKDEKIYTHFIPYKNSGGHPSIKEQQDLANSLIEFLEKELSW